MTVISLLLVVSKLITPGIYSPRLEAACTRGTKWKWIHSHGV